MVAIDLRRVLTDYADPAPILRRVRKQVITYERDDGVQLSATLYLPPEYRDGDLLPMLMWAYPRESTNAAAAGQVRGSPHRFTTLRGASHLPLLTQGFAILDGPTMPIVGEGEGANDTYVEQWWPDLFRTGIARSGAYNRTLSHGATARYVTLPHESHSYAARESVLHVVAEMLNWCNQYLRTGPRAR